MALLQHFTCQCLDKEQSSFWKLFQLHFRRILNSSFQNEWNAFECMCVTFSRMNIFITMCRQRFVRPLVICNEIQKAGFDYKIIRISSGRYCAINWMCTAPYIHMWFRALIIFKPTTWKSISTQKLIIIMISHSDIEAHLSRSMHACMHMPFFIVLLALPLKYNRCVAVSVFSSLLILHSCSNLIMWYNTLFEKPLSI